MRNADDYRRLVGELALALRRFRHAFRNMYQSELDPRRMGILNEDIPGIIADFNTWHSLFVGALSRIAERLEEAE